MVFRFVLFNLKFKTFVQKPSNHFRAFSFCTFQVVNGFDNKELANKKSLVMWKVASDVAWLIDVQMFQTTVFHREKEIKDNGPNTSWFTIRLVNGGFPSLFQTEVIHCCCFII